jgi:hypothetical protein
MERYMDGERGDETTGRTGQKKWTGRLSAAEGLSTVFAGAVPDNEKGQVISVHEIHERHEKGRGWCVIRAGFFLLLLLLLLID